MAFTLRQWRKLKDLSQKEMADRCHVHPNTYMNWERVPEQLTIEKAHIIADALGVDYDDIIFFSKPLQNVAELETV